MMNDKKYYWIKLKDEVFGKDEVLALKGRTDINGYQILMIYAEICLLTVNKEGRLIMKLGNKEQPYTIEGLASKLGEKPKTIAMALDTLEEYGFLEKENNIYKVINFDSLVGTETAWAEKKRKYRQKKKEGQEEGQTEGQNIGQYSGQSEGQKEDIVLEENREKIKEIRDKRKELEKEPEVEVLCPAEQDNAIPYAEIIDYLNEKLGSHYKASTGKTKTQIHARFKEGFTLEDFKIVIDKKIAEWYGTNMEQYLRPVTLFGTKFESYLNQSDRSGMSIKKASNLINWEEVYDV